MGPSHVQLGLKHKLNRLCFGMKHVKKKTSRREVKSETSERGPIASFNIFSMHCHIGARDVRKDAYHVKRD